LISKVVYDLLHLYLIVLKTLYTKSYLIVRSSQDFQLSTNLICLGYYQAKSNHQSSTVFVSKQDLHPGFAEFPTGRQLQLRLFLLGIKLANLSHSPCLN